jgi:Transglutaminase-like superfamily
MKRVRYSALVFCALYEILRYEVLFSVRGIGYILRQASRQALSPKAGDGELERQICDAALLATCFHWKPVLCLQRSVCTTRLLRRHGIDARLVIGYRSSPFFSHAWVEVGGRVVYGSSAYQKRLRPLFVS